MRSKFPPWTVHPNVTIHTTLHQPISRLDPTHLKKAITLECLDQLPPADLIVWTDGSALEAVKDGGVGVYIESPRGNQLLHFPAGQLSSSYRAEMTALEATLNILREDRTTPTLKEVRICTVSQSALETLAKGPVNQVEVLPSKIWEHLLSLHPGPHLTLQRVPGHSGIQGNEVAHCEANKGRNKDQSDVPIDLPTAKTAIRRQAKARAKLRYDHNNHCNHHRRASLGGKNLLHMHLKRDEQATLNQLILFAQMDDNN